MQRVRWIGAIIMSILFVGVELAFSYENIDDALSNGISNGDVIFYGVHTTDTSSQQGVKNANAGYGAGSIGLAYRSEFYKNVRFMISFRASSMFYQLHTDSLWDDDINSPNRKGSKGDGSMDFYASYRTMLGQSYIEYSNGKTSVQAGRIFAKAQWADRLVDGVYVSNKSLPDTLIEVFWAKNNGYVQYNKMTAMSNVNPHNTLGLFGVRLKHSFFDEILSLEGFYNGAPSIFNAFGVKLNTKYTHSSAYVGGSLSVSSTLEGSHSLKGNSRDSFVVDVRAYLGVKDIFESSANGLELSGGFIQSGANGVGSLNIIGNNVSPFFMWGGRAFLLGDEAGLGFGKINFTIHRISLAFVYGTTRFTQKATQNAIFDKVNELNVLCEIGISEHFMVLFNLLNTHGGNKLIYPHQNALHFGLKLSF